MAIELFLIMTKMFWAKTKKIQLQINGQD